MSEPTPIQEKVFQRNTGAPEPCCYCGEPAVVFYSFNPTAVPDMCRACYKDAKSEKADPSPVARPQEDGVSRIAAERQRQIDKEGWTPEHDSEHAENEIAAAAACYIWAARQVSIPLVNERMPLNAVLEVRFGEHNDMTRPIQQDIGSRDWRVPYWPWEPSWWKPSDDPIRNLEKAGALIAAEIDRLLTDTRPPV